MNAHQPEYGLHPSGAVTSVKCAVADCHMLLMMGALPKERYAEAFRSHSDQYEPGRAPDITVDWEPVALCPVCADGVGDIAHVDDGLGCKECGTTWDMVGQSGERAE